jgi:DNA-binding transcriptional ArsR family regulator
MSGLLPSEPDIESGDGEPRVVGVDSEDADRLLAALSSGTARDLLAAVHDDPATPSKLADEVDTSLQNVQYHIEKLEDADLIEVRGTRYSEKGREMNVYGPTDRPLVLFAGSEDDTQGVKSALTRTLGAAGVLALASLVVQQVFGDGVSAPTAGGGEGGDAGGGIDAAEATRTTTESDAGAFGVEQTKDAAEATTTVAQTDLQGQAVETTTAAEQALGLPPGALFFLGGLLVIALGVAWWAVRHQ